MREELERLRVLGKATMDAADSLLRRLPEPKLHLVPALVQTPDPAQRYRPMVRLLAERDAQFLCNQGAPGLARRFRAERRRIYMDYVRDFEQEFRQVQRLRHEAMRATGWRFEVLVRDEREFLEISLRFRWAAAMHALRLPRPELVVAGAMARAQLLPA